MAGAATDAVNKVRYVCTLRSFLDCMLLILGQTPTCMMHHTMSNAHWACTANPLDTVLPSKVVLWLLSLYGKHLQRCLPQ